MCYGVTALICDQRHLFYSHTITQKILFSVPQDNTDAATVQI